SPPAASDEHAMVTSASNADYRNPVHDVAYHFDVGAWSARGPSISAIELLNDRTSASPVDLQDLITGNSGSATDGLGRRFRLARTEMGRWRKARSLQPAKSLKQI